MISYWRGYLSEVRYKLFAHGPADACATLSSLASLKSRILLFVTALTVLHACRQANDPSLKSELTSSIKPTLDYLMTMKFSSGNYPSSVGSASGDLLVHWCHGAPGWIHLFALAYKVCVLVQIYDIYAQNAYLYAECRLC